MSDAISVTPPHGIPSPAGNRRDIDVLVVCTANICRSPVAAALLDRGFASHDVAARVRSAGVAGGRLDVHPDTGAAASQHGIDLRPHRSRLLTVEMIHGADLIVTMTRAHLRRVVAMVPDSWPRTFTLKELTRRLAHVDERVEGGLPAVLDAVASDRRLGDFVAPSTLDDLADPYGLPLAAHAQMVTEVEAYCRDITARLAVALRVP